MSIETVYCVNCGQTNAQTNIVCTNCGMRLQKEIKPFIPPPPSASPELTSASWWDKLNPALKGSIIVFMGILILRSLASVSKGLSCLFGFPVEIILALFQGVLVSRYAAKQNYKYQPKDYPLQAALSAFYVYLPSLFVGIVIGLITGDLLLIPLLVINFLQGIGGILLYVFMTWLSAQIYVRTGGKGMLGILTGVGCISVTVVALILGLVVFILGALGYQALNSFR